MVEQENQYLVFYERVLLASAIIFGFIAGFTIYLTCTPDTPANSTVQVFLIISLAMLSFSVFSGLLAPLYFMSYCTKDPYGSLLFFRRKEEVKGDEALNQLQKDKKRNYESLFLFQLTFFVLGQLFLFVAIFVNMFWD